MILSRLPSFSKHFRTLGIDAAKIPLYFGKPRLLIPMQKARIRPDIVDTFT